MSSEVDVQALAAMVRAKRGGLGLRAAAREIGEISASTLSRVEQGNVPDLDTFVRLCRWLGVESQQFYVHTGNKVPERPSTPETIEAHLRADRALDPETADAMARMIRLLYSAAIRGELPK